ncbi:GmrSD restriction endonuclease domain-containing protein [Massilia sp. SYSU DXS3249]
MANLVNLDAMVLREDFAASDGDAQSFEKTDKITLRELGPDGFIGKLLRKPDFQRETNHWTPEQVVALLKCFVNGDLIPSVILWKSDRFFFVIDGGHRLSVLKAWVMDDYGDGPVSQPFFSYEISAEQKRIAKRVREMVQTQVGTWQHLQAKMGTVGLTPAETKIVNTIAVRGLPIQWVEGDAEKAETSFFNINTQGTPLDDIEELLLKGRKKAISIAARAIIRAGRGHKYWSSFDQETAKKIEELSGKIHSTLFDPELHRPIKTLDLPLGGQKSVRTAIQALIDLCLIAVRDQSGKPTSVEETAEDADGKDTVSVLLKLSKLAQRVSGNENGSLGLHPAVYFYGPTGRHSNSMFMGTMSLIARAIANNNKSFFDNFTEVRERLERILIEDKETIATILQKHPSKRRVEKYEEFLAGLIKSLKAGETPDGPLLVKLLGLEGKIVIGRDVQRPTAFSDDAKSVVFLRNALKSALRCPTCRGYLDTEKSISYDHVKPVRAGGVGDPDNCELMHPYCNQSVKEKRATRA